MLELQRVVKRYRAAEEDVVAVDDVSLRVDAGEMLALQGPSGSGKTTLLLLAACALRADGGSVRYRGRDLASFSERDAAQYLLSEVGLIAQSTHHHLMAHVPAVDNAATKLLLGGVPLPEAHERALRSLEQVGLGHRTRHTPQELSGGERQRVVIARALAAQPKLILADEPTANLDSQRSREIVALLAQLAHERGAGVLLVTHDAEATAAADRVLALRDGRIEVATQAAGLA
jgi:ABC-type lipoprotein export system ATPase subunit